MIDSWVEVESDVDAITIQQTKTIIYWHNDSRISYSCKGGTPNVLNNVLDISQSYCYLKLPTTGIDIGATKSSITLINPQQQMSIKLTQSELRMVEKQDKYNYQITKHQSQMENLKSYDYDIVINLDMFQSTITPYKY